MKDTGHKTPANDWMRITAAAKVLGTHRATVLSRAVKGEFRMQEFGGLVFLWREDVERAARAAA